MEITTHSSMLKSHVIVITGLGGIGKTQVARRFIQKNRSAYKNVIWINSERSETISGSFRKLAEDRLSIPIAHPDGRLKDINCVVEHIFSKLHKTRTLYVYDNVNNVESINFTLTIETLGEKPHVIITSRIQEWGDEIPMIHLREWEFNDAILYVTRTLNDTTDDSDDEKKLLVETLQSFPLAMRQATAHINYQRKVDIFRIADYITKYATQEMLNSTFFTKVACSLYEKTTFTTWKVTIDSIEADSASGKLAIRILNVIAYFDADNIHRDFLNHLIDEDEGTDLCKRVKIDYSNILKSAIRLLVNYSMVDSQERQSVLSVHRLVQQVIQLNLQETNQEKLILRDALTLVSELITVKHAKLDVIVSHAISVFLCALNIYKADSDESLLEEFIELPSQIYDNFTNNVKSNQAEAFSKNISKMFLPALMNIFQTDKNKSSELN